MWLLHLRGLHKPPQSLVERMDGRMQQMAKKAKQPLPPHNHLVQIGDPVLRIKAEAVPRSEITSPFIQGIIGHLLRTLKKYDAVGVSAPQIGIPLRLFAMKTWSPEAVVKRGMEVIDPPLVVINPELETTDSSLLTLYGFSAQVPRHRRILLKGFDPEGKELEVPAQNWTARILQHEMDHLEGRLFIDPPTETTSLEFDYWESVNKRGGDFKLSYAGIGSSHRFLPFKIFF
ncbi:Peptide deformylase, partial [Caligus rogercresseyi]